MDGIYDNDVRLTSKRAGPNSSEKKKNENFGMVAASKSIEWSYRGPVRFDVRRTSLL